MNRIILLIIIPVAYHASLQAQSCTGSLGDPTVVIDFGNKETPPSQLIQENSSYTFAENGCPAAGEYGFRNLLFGCFDNAWITTSADHTSNDANGYYLLVNGAGYGGTFYAQTVNDLCPNTEYQMSVWIANLLRKTGCGGKGIKPDILLQVQTLSGTVLASYKPGKIYETDQLEWKEYATSFKTSVTTTSVVIKIINTVEIGDCGGVVAIDDIALRPCGPIVNALISENNSADVDICDGDTTAFLLKGSYSSGYDNPVLQWQQSPDGNHWQDVPLQNTSNLTVKPKAEGSYFYRFGVAESSNRAFVKCRVYSQPIKISVNPKPFVQVTDYVFGCYGEPVIVFAAGGSTYEWTGPNGFHSASQKVTIDSADFSDEGLYKVKIITPHGCFDTASLNLIIYPAAHVTNVGGDANICEDAGVTLSVSGGTKYKWDPATFLNNDSIATPIARPHDTTRFRAVVINEYGCSDTAYQTVNVWKKPKANAGLDKRTRVGIPVTLDGTVSGTDIRYFWTPPSYMDNPTLLRPAVNTPRSSFYSLTAESNKGCGSVKDEVFIKVYDKIIIPNAFSPNGDGINDTWNIEPLDLFSDADLQIYNRYGQLVFRNVGYFKPWDGKRNGTPMPVGTYYYILDLKLKNEKPMTGNVTILR